MFARLFTNNETQQALLAAQQEVASLKQANAQLTSENEALKQEIVGTQAALNDNTDNQLLQCALNGLSQVQGIRETVLASFMSIEEESHSIEQVNSAFSKSETALRKILAGMEQLGSNMEKMTSNISGLSQMADSINTFVTTISKISDQTNLLALNAAIEAARAGEAGRGFSVVADEVRALATNTNESANEVSDLVKKIIDTTHTTVSAVEEIQASNITLSDSIGHLNDEYEGIVSCCDSMKDTILVSTTQTFIQTVKLDHVVWKGDVYNVIIGNSHKNISDFADHTMCRLGKWFGGDGAQKFGGHNAFKRLEAPHKEVHRAGVEAMKKFKAGDSQGAVKQLNQMEHASVEVMDLLDQLGH
ncbi:MULTISPECIES: methyl-accepting chemotaxis protein [Pseudoalteromonas]|uniref:methyl-accepting chemotaxis protein n=1 Tax=Pseudoalteromonas TaxID=53246 RepID=UPI000FFEB976|nr:methyl-accepting chemotaxis protein [Pseudoalteromonas sp. A757]RXE88801.1 chemotaxis protein [Pseudoalteromonas sp. A757]